jgi:hypothetical protein
LYVVEWLSAVRWVMDRAAPTNEVLEKACADLAVHWLPAVLSYRVPSDTKAEILRRVRAVDPHPFRTAVLSFPAAVWRTALLDVWYPLLELTYTKRHQMGLSRRGLSNFKARLGLRGGAG